VRACEVGTGALEQGVTVGIGELDRVNFLVGLGRAEVLPGQYRTIPGPPPPRRIKEGEAHLPAWATAPPLALWKGSGTADSKGETGPRRGFMEAY
jgi:hypothetical protein